MGLHLFIGVARTSQGGEEVSRQAHYLEAAGSIPAPVTNLEVMKIITNPWIPFKGFSAINLFGVVFVRNDVPQLDVYQKNHEAIHTAQMRELWYLPFYMIYFIEWLTLLRKYDAKDAYYNISFEKEAYNNEHDMSYLKKRRHFAQWFIK